MSLADTAALSGSLVSIIIASIDMRNKAHHAGENSAMSTTT